MYSKIRDDDEVVGIALAQAKLDVVICSGHNALRTSMKEIPLYKRIACGSKAMDTTDLSMDYLLYIQTLVILL